MNMNMNIYLGWRRSDGVARVKLWTQRYSPAEYMLALDCAALSDSLSVFVLPDSMPVDEREAWVARQLDARSTPFVQSLTNPTIGIVHSTPFVPDYTDLARTLCAELPGNKTIATKLFRAATGWTLSASRDMIAKYSDSDPTYVF
jgi:hypothetical protein